MPRTSPAAGPAGGDGTPLTEGELALRLLVTTALGVVVGAEREYHGHPAGIRTLALVAAGSCMFTVLGIEVVSGGDPTRIAAQVVTGVGFLGAGAILRQGGDVRGLTTAASIWVVAAIGMAVGLGFYLTAVFTTALVIVTLVLIRPIERRFFGRHKEHYGRREEDTAAGPPDA